MRLLFRFFRHRDGFTLVELLTVMAIIAILAGLILSISGYATKKGALARADVEIHALSAGCESYKADNGTYPYQMLQSSTSTFNSIPAGNTFPNSQVPSDQLQPAGSNANGNSAVSGATTTPYTKASYELYQALTGDVTGNQTGSAAGVKNYIGDMKSDVWGRSIMTQAPGPGNPVFYLSDPFGNSYGYSTACATASTVGVNGTFGYNPTFDIWSTGGQTATPYTATSGALASGSAGDPMLQWIKNW